MNKPSTAQAEARAAHLAAVEKKAVAFWRRRGRKVVLWVVGVLVIVGAALWCAREPIAAKAETVMLHELNERGVYPRYAGRSWLPWRGLRFEKVVLLRDAQGEQPVVEVSALAVDLPWWQMLRHGAWISRWRTKDATITVHDDAGVLNFQHVTAKVLLVGQQLEILRLQFRNAPLAWNASGRILLPVSPPQPPAGGNFAVDLSWYRSIVATLGIKPETGPFFLQGTFSMDLRQPDALWQAAMTGNGRNVESHGVPLHAVAVSGQLSSANIKVTSNVQLAQGSANLTVSRADWDHAPLLISGQLADARGVQDAVAASFDFAAQSMTISSLTGKAELLTFFHNFPAAVPYLPPDLHVRTAPDIEVKNLLWSPSGGAAVWSGGSIRLRSPADVTLAVGGQSLDVNHLQGEAVFQDKAWQIQATTGRVSYRNVVLPETKLEASFAWPKVKLSTHLTLPKGKADLTLASDNWPRAPLTLTGSLSDAAGAEDRFTARYEGERHLVTLTKLDGKANLVEFAANFPALAAQLPAHLQVRTFPDLAIKDLTYHLDKATDNWSVDSIQLNSGADFVAMIKGQSVPISQLTGSASYNGKTWRFTDLKGQALGGRLAVSGSYGEGVLREATLSAANVRMAQVKAWFHESEVDVDNALLTLDYRGAVGSDPSQLTGNGSLRVENAPFVKVPLLDETYALFSGVLPGVKRGDVGELKATFSAAKGVVTVSPLTASGGAITVTAAGTIDLVQRKVAANATGNLRGVVGVVTSPLSQTLEMEVSGPLDQIRVRSVGPVAVVGSGLSGAAKATGDVLKEGVTLPFKALDWLRGGSEAPKARP